MSPLQAKRILVIEDDTDYQNMLKIRLNINGFDVLTATDALEGLRMIRSLKPDLVILDLKLPGIGKSGSEDMDEQMGLKICRMIKFDAKLQQIPVLIMTCSDSTHDIEQSIRSGADGYLMKTASSEFLIHEISKMIHRKPKLSIQSAVV